MPRRTLLFVACVVVTAFPCRAQDAGAKPQPYRVEIVGLEPTDLQDEFEELSETLERRKEPVETDTQLRRRMNRDVEILQKLLRAYGYYEYDIEVEITEREGQRVGRFIVEPGPQFLFDELAIASVDPEFTGQLPEPADVGLVLGEPALAEAVTSANQKILASLRQSGYPFPTIASRDATVDFDTDTMQVRFEVNPGPKAQFGELQMQGFDTVKPVVAQLERPWDAGDPYDARLLDTYRKRLYDTGLFTVVRVQPVKPVEDGRVDVALEVTERKHRTIGIGASYYTDQGFGTEFFWEHRNLWHRGRKLRLEAQLAQQEQTFATSLIVDRFRRRGQQLKASITGGFEDTDAYESQEIGAALIIGRQLREHLRGSVGFAVRFSEVEQLDETEQFQLFSFPLELAWDSADNALNPTQGFRISAHSEPFFDVLGDTSQFLKTQVTASYYIAFDDDATWVFAHRIKIGSIVGDSAGDVPADERFYAGGGGSVRGYPYQSLAPLFADEEPIGGMSLLETSFEIRYRFAESFGVVGFVDGGTAFSSNFPDFGESLSWGTGVGLRYYSPIGPFRFDFAVPLDKDDHIDDDFQVYLSLGQSF